MRLLLLDKSAYVRGAVDVGEDDELCLCAVTRLELLFSARDAAGTPSSSTTSRSSATCGWTPRRSTPRSARSASSPPTAPPDLAPRPADRLLRAAARRRRAARRPPLRRARRRAGVHADPRGLHRPAAAVAAAVRRNRCHPMNCRRHLRCLPPPLAERSRLRRVELEVLERAPRARRRSSSPRTPSAPPARRAAAPPSPRRPRNADVQAPSCDHSAKRRRPTRSHSSSSPFARSPTLVRVSRESSPRLRSPTATAPSSTSPKSRAPALTRSSSATPSTRLAVELG